MRTNNHPIEKIKNQIIRNARKFGIRGQDLEDCSQDIIMKILMNKGKKRLIDFYLIDWLRAKYGDPRNKSIEQKLNLTKTPIELSHNEILEVKSDKEYIELCNEILKTIKTREERIIFRLRFIWGFYNIEIGNIFERTEAAITLRLKSMLTEFKKTKL